MFDFGEATAVAVEFVDTFLNFLFDVFFAFAEIFVLFLDGFDECIFIEVGVVFFDYFGGVEDGFDGLVDVVGGELIFVDEVHVVGSHFDGGMEVDVGSNSFVGFVGGEADGCVVVDGMVDDPVGETGNFGSADTNEVFFDFVGFDGFVEFVENVVVEFRRVDRRADRCSWGRGDGVEGHAVVVAGPYELVLGMAIGEFLDVLVEVVGVIVSEFGERGGFRLVDPLDDEHFFLLWLGLSF